MDRQLTRYRVNRGKTEHGDFKVGSTAKADAGFADAQRAYLAKMEQDVDEEAFLRAEYNDEYDDQFDGENTFEIGHSDRDLEATRKMNAAVRQQEVEDKFWEVAKNTNHSTNARPRRTWHPERQDGEAHDAAAPGADRAGLPRTRRGFPGAGCLASLRRGGYGQPPGRKVPAGACAGGSRH